MIRIDFFDLELKVECRYRCHSCQANQVNCLLDWQRGHFVILTQIDVAPYGRILAALCFHSRAGDPSDFRCYEFDRTVGIVNSYCRRRRRLFVALTDPERCLCFWIIRFTEYGAEGFLKFIRGFLGFLCELHYFQGSILAWYFGHSTRFGYLQANTTPSDIGCEHREETADNATCEAQPFASSLREPEKKSASDQSASRTSTYRNSQYDEFALHPYTVRRRLSYVERVAA